MKDNKNVYVIKYSDGIYAGTYSDMDGCYCYPSGKGNGCKPKLFKTQKGAIRHLENLKKKVPYGYDEPFKILEWSEDDLNNHLKK